MYGTARRPIVTKRCATIDGRLVDAVTHVAAADGAAGLTLKRVLSLAEVSRASFYQYFPSLDECFFSAYRLHADQLLSVVRAAVRCAPDPEIAVLDALAEMAVSRPDAARLLMIEGLASGRRGLTERQALIDAIGELIRVSPGRQTSDMPAVALVGATMRHLAMRLTAGDEGVSVAAGVGDWARGFARAGGPPRWELATSGTASGHPSQPSAPAISRSPRDGSPRERMLRAAAACVCGKGYRACSVTDVAMQAGVSRRFFYNHFEDKRAAVVAAYEYSFERLLAACAPAFFASGAWEDRVWQAGLEFARFFARDPLLAHLGFGQTYALGPSFAGRVQEFHLAFTWFLDGRDHERPNGPASGGAQSALTAAAVAELAFQSLRHGPALGMLAQLPLVTFVVLTPFIGRDRACAFAESKLETASASCE
jgi:AcrR family transcriptional regulator